MDSIISIPKANYSMSNYKTKVISTIKFYRPCIIHYDPIIFINENNTLLWKDETHFGDFNTFCKNLLNSLKEYSKDFPCEGTIEWKGEDDNDFGYYEMKKNGEWTQYIHNTYYPSPWQEFED